MNRSLQTDRELAILENIHQNHDLDVLRQRDLSQSVGISLGMTNIIIRKLAQKGWLKVRKINNRNIKYAVSPAGMEAIARKGFGFLKRTIKDTVHYKDVIESFLLGVKHKGMLGVELIGASDFDFIIAPLCQKHCLMFRQVPAPRGTPRMVALFSEDAPQGKLAPGLPAGTCASLRKILLDV